MSIHIPRCACRSQRTTSESHFSPSAMWDLGIHSGCKAWQLLSLRSSHLSHSCWFCSFNFSRLFVLHALVWSCVHALVCMWRSEDNLQDLVLSLYHVVLEVMSLRSGGSGHPNQGPLPSLTSLGLQTGGDWDHHRHGYHFIRVWETRGSTAGVKSIGNNLPVSSGLFPT